MQSGDLVREHLRVNQLLTRLRKHALQSPAARGELVESSKAAEREKVVLARWRKAKTQPSGMHNTGGNSIGKAKSTHKKKQGSY